MAEFSIIIPIYNSEGSLARCLDSIKNQSVDNFEVLMVDDGSTDDGAAICETYVEKDGRFKLLRQKNQGPAAARNAGLKIACGRYVAFVDSDDFVSEDYLACLEKEFLKRQADVIFIGYYLYGDGERIIETRIPPASSGKYEDIWCLSKEDMFGYTWIKAFLRDPIRDIQFPETMDLFEDEIFTCQALELCHRIGMIQKPLYYYFVGNPNALTKKVHSDYCQMRNLVFRAWRSLLGEAENADAILEWQAKRAISTCKYYGFEQDVNPKDFFTSLAQTDFFQEYSGEESFDRYLRQGRFQKVLLMRTAYRMRLKMSKARTK